MVWVWVFSLRGTFFFVPVLRSSSEVFCSSDADFFSAIFLFMFLRISRVFIVVSVSSDSEDVSESVSVEVSVELLEDSTVVAAQ